MLTPVVPILIFAFELVQRVVDADRVLLRCDHLLCAPHGPQIARQLLLEVGVGLLQTSDLLLQKMHLLFGLAQSGLQIVAAGLPLLDLSLSLVSSSHQLLNLSIGLLQVQLELLLLGFLLLHLELGSVQ